MKTIVTFLSVLFYSTFVISQIEEYLLVQCYDSTFIKENRPTFDSEGNFMFSVETDSGDVVIKNYDTIGPMNGWAGGGMSSHFHTDQTKGKYYLDSDLPQCYGPTTGENLSYFRRPLSKNKNFNAVAIFENDSISIYINGHLIKKIDTLSKYGLKINGEKAKELKCKKYQFENSTWASFSESGNVIYSLEENYKYNLYINHKLVKVSDQSFLNLHINNDGEYTYRTVTKTGNGDTAKYFGLFYIKDTFIGPVSLSIFESVFLNSGAYFFSNGSVYNKGILINGNLHLDSINSEINSIIMPDKDHYLCLKTRKDKYILHVNKNTYELNYKKVYKPSIDSFGNFALFVLDNYFLYRWKNGEIESEPITNFGIRPTPIYITPKGEVLVLYERSDSSYLFRNNEMLFKSLKGEIIFTNLNNLFMRNVNQENHSNGHDYIYLEVNNDAYIIIDGKIIPLEAKLKKSKSFILDEIKAGELISGNVSDQGFYYILKESENTYSVNINNQYFHINDLSKLFYSSFFDGKKLVFYGIKSLSLYQFIINL